MLQFQEGRGGSKEPVSLPRIPQALTWGLLVPSDRYLVCVSLVVAGEDGAGDSGDWREADPQQQEEEEAGADTMTTVVSEGLRASWPTILTLLTRDQYGHLVHVPNLKVSISLAQWEVELDWLWIALVRWKFVLFPATWRPCRWRGWMWVRRRSVATQRPSSLPLTTSPPKRGCVSTPSLSWRLFPLHSFRILLLRSRRIPGACSLLPRTSYVSSPSPHLTQRYLT